MHKLYVVGAVTGFAGASLIVFSGFVVPPLSGIMICFGVVALIVSNRLCCG